jgi:DNA-binding NarL/FixJ family response regulator
MVADVSTRGFCFKTVVFTTPGPLQREWLSFLRTAPALDVVAVTENHAAFQAAIYANAPHLAILDSTWFSVHPPPDLHQLKAASRRLIFLAVVENLGQVTQALDAGADQALLRGFSAAEFFKFLQSISLAQPKSIL